MQGRKQKKIMLLTVLFAALLGLLLWTLWGNTALELNAYTVKSEKLPAAFQGYRIVHISDLHNAQMGENNEKLLKMIGQAKPDMIAITGDLVDSRDTDIPVALDFAAKAMEIAPCYYVTGNHEARIPAYAQLRKGLQELGVTVLENAAVEIGREGEKIGLIGVDDPSFQTDYLFGDAETVLRDALQKLNEQDTYAVLLSHRPELFDMYVESGVDLVLTGHAHGGQFRLPWIGGLAAPNQGLFPQYDAGIYTEKQTNMMVSRGIGNSIIPIRFNNRLEVIVITLSQ